MKERIIKKFYINDDLSSWDYPICSHEDNILKGFSKKERSYWYTFQIVTRDKTDHGRGMCIREISSNNVHIFNPTASEKLIDLTFLLYKALKIMRENPDLDVEIHLVSEDSYVYAEGKDGDMEWVPFYYTEPKKGK